MTVSLTADIRFRELSKKLIFPRRAFSFLEHLIIPGEKISSGRTP